MFPLTEENKHVAQLLLSTGTCPRCIFRFCGVDFHAPYKRPYKELLNELQKFLETEKEELISDVPNPPPKKIRLQELEDGIDGIDNLSQNGEGRVSILEDGSIASKNSNLNVCNVCLGILQEFCEKEFIKKVCQKVEASGFEFTNLVFSVSFPPQLSVREKKQNLSLGRNDIVQLKEAYKWITHPLFSEELGVPIDGKDCHFLRAICPDCFKPAKNKQSVFTRMAVMKALNKIKEEDFRKQFPWRYNKYSRNLPQTPWIIDGERKLESSVEELISDHLLAVFKAESFNFSSSGREDVDVRTLGNEKINNSSNKIQVRDLQLVTREAIGHMKEGEEEKTKSYSALIWTNKAIQKKDIEFLNDIKDLKIDQKTPLRVLHRRPLAVRTRIIHSMETRYVDEHHFHLYLKTQAGTLDVESVDVDWPPALDD
ncbi:tRNA pseudouridine synthase Pus10 isoform X1 [Prionailurus iriomotensis]